MAKSVPSAPAKFSIIYAFRSIFAFFAVITLVPDKLKWAHKSQQQRTVYTATTIGTVVLRLVQPSATGHILTHNNGPVPCHTIRNTTIHAFTHYLPTVHSTVSRQLTAAFVCEILTREDNGATARWLAGPTLCRAEHYPVVRDRGGETGLLRSSAALLCGCSRQFISISGAGPLSSLVLSLGEDVLDAESVGDSSSLSPAANAKSSPFSMALGCILCTARSIQTLAANDSHKPHAHATRSAGSAGHVSVS